jgi:hypothetical protein
MLRGIALGALALLCTACSTRAPATPREPRPPAVVGKPIETPPLPAVEAVQPVTSLDDLLVLESAEGEATYYAGFFEGRPTASGVVFSNAEYYAAHRTYPFGTIVRVTNLINGRSLTVRIVDRGPHGSSARARATIIDLSQRAAAELDFIVRGRVPVRVDVLTWGS